MVAINSAAYEGLISKSIRQNKNTIIFEIVTRGLDIIKIIDVFKRLILFILYLDNNIKI